MSLLDEEKVFLLWRTGTGSSGQYTGFFQCQEAADLFICGNKQVYNMPQYLAKNWQLQNSRTMANKSYSGIFHLQSLKLY